MAMGAPSWTYRLSTSKQSSVPTTRERAKQLRPRSWTRSWKKKLARSHSEHEKFPWRS
uniref:Uncharacterized protein n=1 Tax=Arundo donax TaxID=35708 RepID=A0A0A9ADS8_ARUDO